MVVDSRIATYEHIREVQALLLDASRRLQERALRHDRSKLESPEREAFNEFTPKLAASTYGSEEYRGFLAAMKPALDHHYSANDHHPEHHRAYEDPWLDRLQKSRDAIEFGSTGVWATDAVMVMDADLRSRRSSIRAMSLIQILEMLLDWKAATLRHRDGDLARLIEVNQRRFGYSDEMKMVLINTSQEMGLIPLLAGPLAETED